MSTRPHPTGPLLLRRRTIRGYDRGDAITIIGGDGVPFRFSDESAALVRAILDYLVFPRSREQIYAHLSELAGEPINAGDTGGVVDEALTLLASSGILEESTLPDLPSPEAKPNTRRVVLALSGAIGSTHAPLLVEKLLARGFEVRIAATRNALRFVSALSLEALTHSAVVSSLWPVDARAPVPHLELAQWADFVVIYPASAASLARMAAGLFDDVVTAIALSARCPVLIAPSMNEAMFASPSVQRNLATLREDGFFVALPAYGVEVAEEPKKRRPMRGVAPPVSAIVDLLEVIEAEENSAKAPPPKPAPSWDELYRDKQAEELPWFTEELDADIAAALSRFARPGALVIDIGTGLGTAAIEASKRGCFVVATDVSSAALERAKKRSSEHEGASSIAWVLDDIRSTRLSGGFELAIDRGCLHALPEADQRAYVEALRTLLEPGGVLLLKCHSAAEPRGLGTYRFDVAGLSALFEAAFELTHVEETTFPGPAGEAPRALYCELRRL